MKADNWEKGKQNAKLLTGNKKLMLLGVVLLLIVVVVGIGVFLYFSRIKKEPYQPCTDNYQHLSLTGFCYKTYTKLVTHEDAQVHCDYEGGNLVSINSDIENNFVIYLYNWTTVKSRSGVDPFAENSEVWIGLEYDPYEKAYISIDGTIVGYNFFIQETGKKQRGPFFVIRPNNGGVWESRNSTTLASYTCKRPAGAVPQPIKKLCSNGYTLFRFTGFCYKAFLDRVTYHNATQKCNSEGAYLTSINSFEEHRDVIKLYKTRLQNHYEDYAYVYSYVYNYMLAYLWTGLTYNGSSWSWSDGSKLDWNNFQNDNWKSPSTGQNWTAIVLKEYFPEKTINDTWITVGDPNYFSFVCKKPDTSVTLPETPTFPESSTTTTPSTDIIGNSKNCSKGYKFFEMTGYCYKFMLKRANFTAANNKCQKENGQLASIHSKEEDQFLLNMAKKELGTSEERYEDLYIGLVWQNNRWEWTDGTPVDYLNWAVEGPNFLETEQWIAITYEVLGDHSVLNGWNSIESVADLFYFCKKAAE